MEDNKDYILNIRVSKETYDKLKKKAKENSESLSGLVRKTIDDSWEIFGDLRDDLFGAKPAKEGVVHYQKVILAKNAECSRCGTIISSGTEGYVGQTKSGESKYFCQGCFITK